MDALVTNSGKPETLSIEAAAARLGVSRSLAYRLAREDGFPVRVIRLGRRLVVSTAALDRLLHDTPNDEPRPNGEAA